jgi:hypothetical protein
VSEHVTRRANTRVAEPIILMGAPRSGTSLLAEVLGSHPDVALAREPRLVWRYRNDDRSDQLRPEHATPEVIAHIHDSFGALLAEQRATRLVEKTPANAVRPAFVDAVFPDARYVHIVRDGWAAVPSISSFWERRGTGLDRRQLRKLRRRISEAHPTQFRHYVTEAVRRVSSGITTQTPLYGPRLAGLQPIVEELGRMEAAALQWQTCVAQVATFGRGLADGRYREIRLESLCTDTIAELLECSGLRVADEVLRRFEELYRPDDARRRARLTAGERECIAPYVVPLNAWLGYAGLPADEASGCRW